MKITLAQSARTLLTLTLLLAGPSAADDISSPDDFRQKRQHQVEIFVSSIFANSATDGSFGLRGAFQLKKRFHLEAGLSRINDRADFLLADISAKYYLRDRERTDVFVLAGPGILYSSDLGSEEVMVHAGVGAEFSVGQRFYLRPELRGRWFVEDVDAVSIGDLSLGFGWRF